MRYKQGLPPPDHLRRLRIAWKKPVRIWVNRHSTRKSPFQKEIVRSTTLCTLYYVKLLLYKTFKDMGCWVSHFLPACSQYLFFGSFVTIQVPSQWSLAVEQQRAKQETTSWLTTMPLKMPIDQQWNKWPNFVLQPETSLGWSVETFGKNNTLLCFRKAVCLAFK